MISTPSPPRSPWQLFYGLVHRLRRRHYRSRAAHLPRPVVSVGNLHWGGAGKTPLVAALALHLRDRGLRIAILSRGYGRRDDGVRLVSDGRGPLLGPTLAGDEPVLLAEQLPGVAVLVGADRYSAGIQALERLDPAPDLFLLDDGFSHVRLFRDLDLLAFPASDPLAGGRLAPGGRLREPLASAAWAHAALLTDAAEADAEGDAEALRQALAAYGFRGPAFACRTHVDAPQAGRREPLPAEARVLLVTGIARPERVARAVAALPVEVVERMTFPDHHAYPEASLERILEAHRRSGADWVLTTAKDHVKLLGRLEAPLAVLPVRADPDPAFWEWLEGRLLSAGEPPPAPEMAPDPAPEAA
jgi:tetraacyldisaccharide 4'-kinase